MRRMIAFGLAACIGAAALTGCGNAAKGTETAGGDTASEQNAADGQAASGLDRLVLTYVTSPLNVPTIIERDKNIFADAFKDMGVSVEYAEINSGADQTQALASGDVQILYAVGATSVILSAANGADIKVLNMYSRSPEAFCMYAADDSLSTPESLKGRPGGNQSPRASGGISGHRRSDHR